MRALGLAAVLAAGCGRLGFDPRATGDAGHDPPTDAPPAPTLACGETRAAGAASPMVGTALDAAVSSRGLAALWIDTAGALRGTTWRAEDPDAGDGVELVRDGVALGAGPYTRVWAVSNDDLILVGAAGPSRFDLRLLRGDLTEVEPPRFGTAAVGLGRVPFARHRERPTFVLFTTGGDGPGLYALDTPNVVRLFLELAGHGNASIAADRDGYVIVTEHTDAFGFGCSQWKLSDQLGLLGGPVVLESTEQADCDQSTVSSGPGRGGVGLAWMDRDPQNSYVAFSDAQGSSGGFASGPGETVGLPIIESTSAGVALIYRASPSALRACDGAGVRTLSDTAALADLVTWSDTALVIWTTETGAPKLTRLCP